MSNYNNFFKNNPIKIKHYDTLLNDDTLQWGMYGSNQDRYFKDQSTDFFTKVFLSDDKIRWMFVDYVYHILLFNLNTKINKLLEDLYETYMFENEHFFLVFKGGNVMNLYYGNLKTQIDEYRKNCPYQFDKHFIIANVKDFLKDLDNNFQISDVDFSLYIDCMDYIKYLKISHCIKIIVSDTLKSISVDFDNYYDSVMNSTVNKNYIPIKCTDTMKQLETNETKFRFFIDLLKNNIVGITEIYLKNLFIRAISIFNKPHQLIKLYLVFEKIALKYNFDLSNELDNLKLTLTSISNTKFNNLISSDFYTQTKINEFICKLKDFYLKENFCVKFKDTYEDQTHTVYLYVYEGNKLVDPLLNKRNSAIVHNDENLNKPVSIINTDPNSVHYITYNASILKTRSCSTSNFDLFRIKFNVELNNVINEYIIAGDYEDIVKKLKERQIICDSVTPPTKLFATRVELDTFISDNNFKLNKQSKTKYNTPSEFIDLSMPAFADSTSQHFIESIENNTVSNIYTIIDKTLYYTDCYSKAQIYDDINIVLFQQNTYFPWVDKKYEKRIKRLITMLFISNLEYSGGKYTLNHKMRSILKNLVHTCVIILNSLSSGNRYNIDVADIKKYLNINYGGSCTNINTILFLIKTININNELIDFTNIYKINEDYRCIRYLLNFILIFYKLFSDNTAKNNEDIIDFCNIYKFVQLWTPFDKADSDYIAGEIRNKYTKLLKTIVEIGRVLLLIF